MSSFWLQTDLKVTTIEYSTLTLTIVIEIINCLDTKLFTAVLSQLKHSILTSLSQMIWYHGCQYKWHYFKVMFWLFYMCDIVLLAKSFLLCISLLVAAMCVCKLMIFVLHHMICWSMWGQVMTNLPVLVIASIMWVFSNFMSCITGILGHFSSCHIWLLNCVELLMWISSLIFY